jgi:hypothetical protein
MRTRALEFMRMDAGERRTFLAEDLAEWIDAGFWDYLRARVFYRRVRILARSIDASFVDVMTDVRADAEALLNARGATRTES